MMFIIVFMLILVTHVSAASDPCPKCGSIEVPFPLSTDESCGDTKYRVYCNNNVLEFLSADGFYYKILRIDPLSYKLVISPPLIPKNTCHTSDLFVGGLTLDESLPFNVSGRNTVMLFHCPSSILSSPLNCSLNSFCRDFEDVKEGIGCKGSLCCHYKKDASMTSHRIRVRVGGCTAYTSVVDLKPGDSIDSWSYGIELQWLPPN